MAFRIGFLLYPNLTQLDMTGPAQVLSRMPGATVDFVWKDKAPVMSDCNLALMPTLTLADSGQFDMICVPGGYGCTALMTTASSRVPAVTGPVLRLESALPPGLTAPVSSTGPMPGTPNTTLYLPLGVSPV